MPGPEEGEAGGELCEGLRLHSFNTPRYTQEVILPSIEGGARKADRQLSDIDVVSVCTLTLKC